MCGSESEHMHAHAYFWIKQKQTSVNTARVESAAQAQHRKEFDCALRSLDEEEVDDREG